MARDKSGDGNSMASAAGLTRMLVRQAEALHRIENTLGQLEDEDIFVLGMSLRAPNYEKAEWLAVLRADSPNGRLVAFHNAPSYAELVSGVAERLTNRSIKWKADQYGE